MGPLETPRNYSIYAIPAFYVLIMVPYVYGSAQIRKANNGEYDRVNPRGEEFALKIKKSTSKATLALIERCKAAHNNGWENLPFFAAAVLAANFAHLPASTLNLVAAIFLLCRTVFVIAYIGATTAPYALCRSAAHIGSVSCCWYLLLKAAHVVARP